MPELFLVKDSPQQAPDAEQRAAALDIFRSFIVEAPAGSGKTALLIQRLLKLLADDSVTEPEQVLAITFTVKATAELRERVLAQLDNAATNTPVSSPYEIETRTLAEAVLTRDRAYNWGLRERPKRLNIRTIDSVCAEIARSLPVLSGSGGQLSPILDAAPLHREAASRTFQMLGGSDPILDAALRDLLLHRDGNLADCERLLAEVLALRDQWGELIPLAGASLTDEALDSTIRPKLEAALDHAICIGLNRLAQSLPAEILESLTHLAAEMGHAPGYSRAPSPISLCAGIHTAPEATAASLDHWRALIHLLVTSDCEWRKERGITGRNLKFEYDRKHPNHATLCAILDQLASREDSEALLEAFRQARLLPPAKYPKEQWAVARSLFRILRHALVELQFVFSERNECDFTEFSLLARTALGKTEGADDLAAALGMRLQHLLVDEMQDTSTSQYELIERLTQGWDGHSQTVFLVGDPKQSIYLFRQARVERFVRTMRTGLLGDLPLDTLRLTANFRSQQSLVEQVNADFSLILRNEDIPFIAAAPTRSTTIADAHRWHTHTLAAATDAPTQRIEDARAIRHIIQHWRAQKPSCTIAVLVRSRSHLAEIVAALKQTSAAEESIPFRAVDIDALADRQEVLDLFALTRALLHPADRIAWLAILRAPWCGLTLADLHHLTGADDTAHTSTTIADLFHQRGDLLSPDGCQRLERLWLVMDAAAKKRARLTTAQWVERTWRSLGGDLWLDAEATANALRYLELLDEIEKDTATGTMDLALLESSLKRLYAKPAEHPHAVDLMTIHGSKGLEWDVVIVPALERRGQSSRSRLLTWVELDSSDPDSAPIVLAPIIGRGEPSRELNDWLRSIENAREAAERKRLVYVACTRAREELHLFASPTLTKGNAINPVADSLLRAAWPAAESHFVTQSTNLLSDITRQLQSSLNETDAVFLSEASSTEPNDLHLPFATELLELAAAPAPPPLHRLPSKAVAAHFASFKPLHIPTEDTAPLAHQTFERPEGGFAARAFGTAVHVFLEHIAQRIATGDTPAALTTELPQWLPRIAAILRAEGLPPATTERLAQKVQFALQNTLADPIGQWLLAAHPDAASERALTAYQPRRTGIRLDRIFRAGAIPLANGTDHLWIVDFKTTTPAPTGLEAFLQRERETYTPQMNAYAQVLGTGEASPICILLYYPMLPTYTTWKPEFGRDAASTP